jgi:predicted acyl esterase
MLHLDEWVLMMDLSNAMTRAPGFPVEYPLRIDLHFTSRVFETGHRIRMAVGSDRAPARGQFEGVAQPEPVDRPAR